METYVPSTSTQPMSADSALDRPTVGMNHSANTMASSAPPSQSSDTKDVATVKRNVVPDLPSLCFPLINARMRPIDLSRPLPVSPIVRGSNERRNAVGRSEAVSMNQPRANPETLRCHHGAKYRLRRARREIFYKMGLRQHWCDEKKLIAAVQSADLDKAHLMLDFGVNPNTCDQKLRTALHIAASQGQNYLVRLLLSKKANPNYQDILGNTPLHLAVCKGDRATVKVLIENGANIFAMDNNGRTPLTLVKSRLGTIRRDQTLSADKMKSEFMLISDFLHAQAKRMKQPSETSMDDLCQMMQTVSTREQADEIADAVFVKMADISIKNIDRSAPASAVTFPSSCLPGANEQPKPKPGNQAISL